uniref:Uncharacterized protein n=1 Tax=Chenopodium quinoa TaxID=63459 RepID=A0A803NF13_CHEQI
MTPTTTTTGVDTERFYSVLRDTVHKPSEPLQVDKDTSGQHSTKTPSSTLPNVIAVNDSPIRFTNVGILAPNLIFMAFHEMGNVHRRKATYCTRTKKFTC